jgi:methyl-accepting chemotaxis protein
MHQTLRFLRGAIQPLRRFRAFPGFVKEAKAYASVLPVLSRQLKDTVGSIEEGTKAVCSSFGEMAALARSSVERGALLVEESGSRNMTTVIQDCRSTISKMSDRLERSGELYGQAIAQMEAVNHSVQQVFAALKELDKNSFASRLVALNAKVEAVHLGQLGAGFEVVAEQISTQATRSSELTTSVGSILTDLTKTMQGAMAELKAFAAEDRQAAELSRADVEQALQDLQYASSQMQNTAAENSLTSETLYKQISQAVVSMQFQDRVSQRIGHVVDSLNAMDRALSSFEHSPDAASLDERKRQVKDSLLSSYTMESERMAHDPITAASAEAGGDVELF